MLFRLLACFFSSRQMVHMCESLTEHLKPHQIDALRFIWDNCIER